MLSRVHAGGYVRSWLLDMGTLQVSHAEDRRNFSGGSEDSHPAGKSNKRYVSTGLFKDF